MDQKRVEKKLPSLMVTKGTGVNSAEYQRKERQLRKLRQQKPALYMAKVHAVFAAINALDQAVIDEIDDFNRRNRR